MIIALFGLFLIGVILFLLWDLGREHDEKNKYRDENLKLKRLLSQKQLELNKWKRNRDPNTGKVMVYIVCKFIPYEGYSEPLFVTQSKRELEVYVKAYKDDGYCFLDVFVGNLDDGSIEDYKEEE